MSVEIEGPKGFEYQYLVTVYIALEYFEEEEEQVFVENKGFEDAFVSFRREEKHYIDVQVKHKSKDVTLKDFCGWLAHFKQRSKDTFLLEQLQQKNHSIVFVTDSRCTDAVSVFLYASEDKSNLTKQEIAKIRKNILESIDDKKNINIERNSYVKKFLNGITDKELNSILKKVRIIENQKTEVVEDKIYKKLKVRYLIPEVICKDVLKQMLEVVQKGRDTGSDIIPDIKQIIADKSMKRILPEDSNYCVRESFETFRKLIDDKHVLLLTGVPFSGKTSLAKAIAQSYLEEGYNIKRTEDLIDDNEAYHFLMSKENDSRVLLLEDPFGHMKLREDGLEEWDKLNKLIRECVSANRKIVVTSRNDILLELRKKTKLEECCLNGHRWIDTSINSKHEAESIWKKYFGKSGQDIFEQLYHFFQQENKQCFLEVGEIAHLYTNIPEISDLKEMKSDEIIQCASVSAEEVCKKIESYGEIHRQLFILLGGFCNTIKAIGLQDFAYILHGENLKLSIRKNEELTSVSVGGTSDEQIYPEYGEAYVLELEEKKALRELCRSGYIYRDRITNEISFKHPLYHYASRILLQNELEEGWEIESLTDYLQKGIGSLARNGAICALDTLTKHFELNQQVVDCFFDGSNSIFPAVRDCAILFLDRNFENLNEEKQREFMKNISHNQVADRYLNWIDDECWYHLTNSYHYSFKDMWEFSFHNSNNIDNICRMIEAGKTITKQQIYQILYSSFGAELSLEFLEYALLKEEAVIRSKAMYYIFSVHGEELHDIQKKYLNGVENYNVVYGIIKGAMDNWSSFSEQDKRILVEYIKEQLYRKSVAFYLKELIENYGDEYSTESIKWEACSEDEKRELWKLWAELFAQWLSCFPAKFISAHEPHMVYTAEQSLPYLENTLEIVTVTEAWLKWLKEYTKIRCVDDYGMSVMDYLINGTKEVPMLRKNIIARVLEEKDTSILTSHLFHMLNNWEILCEEEKINICDFLQQRVRPDYKWLYAVCIVMKNVPKEIQTVICGQEFLDKRPEEIMKVLEKEDILEECISVFCGFPQPLWWNGYHHQGEYKQWYGVMAEVLKCKKFNQSYYIALREFIDALYNKENYKFENGYLLYKQQLQDETARKWIFERLAYEVNTNQDCKAMWDDLLGASTEEEKIEYFKRISNFIEIVEYKNMGYQGLFTEFEEKDISKYLLPNFLEDSAVIKLCEYVHLLCKDISIPKEINISSENGIKIEEDKEARETVKDGFKRIIIEIYQEEKIRLCLTDKVVKSTVKKLDIEFPELEEIMKRSKENFWKRYESKQKEFQENCPLDINDMYSLSNWCDSRLSAINK